MQLVVVNPYFNGAEELPKDSVIVNVTQLSSFCRSAILKHLQSTSRLPENLANATLLTAAPRNYYIDVLFAKDYELFYDEDQLPPDEPALAKRLVRLPLTLEAVGL